jgi:hypothetical protein
LHEAIRDRKEREMSHQNAGDSRQESASASIWSLIGLPCVAVLLLLGLSIDLEDSKSTDFGYPEIRVDAKQLETSRESHYEGLSVTSATESEIKLHELLRSLGDLQFKSEEDLPDPKEIKDLLILLEFHSDELVIDLGYEGFLLATMPVLDACDKALDATLSQLSDGTLKWENVQSGPDLTDSYRENCGNFLPELEKTNLISKQGEWRNPSTGPLVANILNRYRIGSTLRTRTPTWKQLTAYEASVYCQLVVGQRAFPRERRRECLERLRTADPTYDADLADLLLDIEDDRLERALTKVNALVAQRKDKRRFWALRGMLENLIAQPR